MRASVFAGLLAAGSAHAFSDSSPFLLFSSAELPPATSQLQTSARVLETAKSLLAECPTSRYLIVAQPNAHASDLYSPQDGCEAHRLRRALDAPQVRGRFTVAEVVAQGPTAMTASDFISHINASCVAKGAEATFDELTLPALPQLPTCQERAEAMADNDYLFGNVADALTEDYTIVYFSSSSSPAHGEYVAAFEDPAQMPVPVKKRAAEQHMPLKFVSSRAAASKEVDRRPLFEKYQFFTPGIFMGLVVFFILLSILYVGLSAVASLKVPYGAFDKENGPSGQKKQQ